MTDPNGTRRPEPPAGSTADVLWHRVVEAREAVLIGRRGVGNASLALQAELLSALEAYAENLELRRRPVPYALRDEIRLRRLAR